MKEKIHNLIKKTLSQMFDSDDFTLEHPADIKNGDFSTNVAMVFFAALRKDSKETTGSGNIQVSGHYNSGSYEWKNPRECAESIKEEILKNKPDYISDIQVAGPGFINFYLARSFFSDSVKEILNQKENWGKNNTLSGKKFMVEYTDPNPFKPFHIGHLMTNTIGESLARIVEFCGARTIRANYQGDIGPHVAKAIYTILQDPQMIDRSQSPSVQAYWIGKAYSHGASAYEDDLKIKAEIDEINKKIYERTDEKINEIYDWGREVTLEAFEEIYALLGTTFDYYFFESAMAPIGMKIVKEHIGSVFTESEGAIVFEAQNYDPKLHTRVFINSKGLPTYETKEVGLTVTKFEKENPDLSIIITAVEQAEYMKVVQKAISLIHPDYESRMRHITHGMMKFASGKMSSRKGNVVTGESLIQDSTDVIREKIADRDFSDAEKKDIAEIIGVAALKYSILRSSIGGDIVYDFEKSISFEGDSGPYLQYTAVRAHSILQKAEKEGITIGYEKIPTEVSALEQKLYQFEEVVVHAYQQLQPHYVTTYLTELASAFNSFYAHTTVLSSEYNAYYVALVKAFYQTMKNGLSVLGIRTPEKM